MRSLARLLSRADQKGSKGLSMASSLESNKIAAAVLTAGVVAMLSGFVAELLYHPHVTLEENSYVIAVGEGAAPAAVTAASRTLRERGPSRCGAGRRMVRRAADHPARVSLLPSAERSGESSLPSDHRRPPSRERPARPP